MADFEVFIECVGVDCVCAYDGCLVHKGFLDVHGFLHFFCPVCGLEQIELSKRDTVMGPKFNNFFPL